MIIFPYLRTKRIAVGLREPTLEEAIAVCSVPGDRHEATTTAFLQVVASSAETPRPGYVTDPRLWTAGERIRVLCQYLMQMSDEGPDFSLGEGRLTDYSELELDEVTWPVPVGEIDGVGMVYRPLVGALLEVMEQEFRHRGEWIMGAMACQLLPADEPEPDWAQLSSLQVLDWVRARVIDVKKRGESDFGKLMTMAVIGQEKTRQFFNLEFSDTGVVCMPIREAGLHPARFRAISCLSPATRSLFERPEQPDSQADAAR